MMNKYGCINDMPNCDKRVYNLWFQMLRRCYDTTQHEREKGSPMLIVKCATDGKCYHALQRTSRNWKGTMTG